MPAAHVAMWPAQMTTDDDTLDKIDARAEKVGLSRNAWITRALEWALNQPVTTRTKQEQV